MGPYHVMRSSAEYFRSKCSKKGWRPRKGSRREDRCNQQEEQEEHEQTDASDPAGTLTALHVNAPSPYNLWQSTLYDYSVFSDYTDQIGQHALTADSRLPPSWYHTWDYWPDCSEPYQANITAMPLQIPKEQVSIGVRETIQVACAECGCECQSTTSDYPLLSWCERCWCDG
jgi:hypothetical protein